MLLVRFIALFSLLLSLPAVPAEADPLGEKLHHHFIWISPSDSQANEYAVFRKSFDVLAPLPQVIFHCFAYTRYQLYLNGDYVGSGPGRNEKERIEYDSWKLNPQILPGRNVITLLVSHDWPDNIEWYERSLSRFHRHPPGFSGLIAMTTSPSSLPDEIATDTSWIGIRDECRSLPLLHQYSSIPDNIDATKGPDLVDPKTSEANLAHAVLVDTADRNLWPIPVPRSIPLLCETNLPFTTDIYSQDETVAHTDRIVQARWVIEIDAKAGTRLSATPILPEGYETAPSFYTCRAGNQTWRSGDTFALNGLLVAVESGHARFRVKHLISVRYPFERTGSFSCSDSNLNAIWKITARSLELLSEDAYTDCADRERSEWMDNDPPMYDATRVMMSGKDQDGNPVWSDPRLFAALLRRVAQTQEADGRLRARTCSDLVDIHTYMVDRSCDWVEGQRKYFEATGDKNLIEEIYPHTRRFLTWLESQLGTHGLIQAREWIAWDNPLAYATCEGAANNAFFARAFLDASLLAEQTGHDGDSRHWKDRGDQLTKNFNQQLWSGTDQAYFSSIGTPVILPGDDLFRHTVTIPVVKGHTAPTLFSNLFALDQGVVPPDREKAVIDWVLQHANQVEKIMSHYYYFKLLYGLNDPENDTLVLNRIRTGWKGMRESPWQTTWEGVGGGSKIHCYGIVPGYILSTYVLGVRRDAPVWEKKLVIEPHLGDLTEAHGVVVTEFGPVPVSWVLKEGEWHFSITVPHGIQAEVRLPAGSVQHPVVVNNQPIVQADLHGRLHLSWPEGHYSGSFPGPGREKR